MALRYFDGFDFYPQADLRQRYSIVNGAMTTNATAGRFGTGCLTNNASGGSEWVWKFLDPQPTWIIGFAYKFATGGIATPIAGIAGPEGGQINLEMDSDNRLILTQPEGYLTPAVTLATGTTVLLPNTYYYLEMKVTIADACAANSCQARIGGGVDVTMPTGTSTNRNGSGVASRAGLSYGHVSPIYFDDFYILDGTGTDNIDFLGDMRVETLLPNAQGQYADFSVSGASSHYGAVNEHVEDGDASYVFAGSVGKSESYLFPNLVSNPTAIAGMQLVTVARKDDAGSRALMDFLRIAGNEYDGPEMGISDTYAYLTTLFEKNPATAALWTGADVNAVEAGFRVTR